MGEHHPRPAITFIPLSSDARKIRFFGTLMPALLLLKTAPLRFLQDLIERRRTPRAELTGYIREQCDDAGQVGDTLVFLHRWHSLQFDPFTFAHARTFLAQITRMIRRQGYTAEPVDPLSPDLNLPKLAAQAGLGNLSPFGLLVHDRFGPRVILSGLRTSLPIALQPRWPGPGCSDCLSCVRICPQAPAQFGEIDLSLCQNCTRCLRACPTGKKLVMEEDTRR